MWEYHHLQRWSSKFYSHNPVLLVYGYLLLCTLRAICDFLMVNLKEFIGIKFCFKLSNTTSVMQEVKWGWTVMNQQLIAELFVEKPFLSTLNKTKAYQAKHHTNNRDIFWLWEHCSSEFIPAGQTIKPVLLLRGFTTFQEGIPPKIYGITIG